MRYIAVGPINYLIHNDVITVVNLSAAGRSVLSATFSSAILALALSVFGLPGTIPLGVIGGCFALASSGLIIASKKLDSRITKHQDIVTLAMVRRETACRSVSFHSND